MNEFSIFNTPDVDCVEAAKEILPEYFHRPIPHLPAPDGTMDPTAVIGVFVEKKSECQFLTVLARSFGFKTTKALADISGKVPTSLLTLTRIRRLHLEAFTRSKCSARPGWLTRLPRRQF